jgi:hypothetical protein
MRRIGIAAATGITTFLFMVSGARADYGNLENSSTYGWCGATSITNSLQYLQNMYPNVYGTKLIDGTLAQTRTDILTLETGVHGGNATMDDPASNQTVWNSKIEYINNVAPGTTVFAAQMDPLVAGAGYDNPTDIQSVIPTDTFLQQQIAAGEDVEIGINNFKDPSDINDEDSDDFFDDMDTAYDDGQDVAPNAHEIGGGHMVTLTGIDSEDGTLAFLDPNNPSAGEITADFSMGSDGYLTFLWNNMGANPPQQADIYEAWAESPVPEPTAIALCFGATLLALRRHRRPARDC